MGFGGGFAGAGFGFGFRFWGMAAERKGRVRRVRGKRALVCILVGGEGRLRCSGRVRSDEVIRWFLEGNMTVYNSRRLR